MRYITILLTFCFVSFMNGQHHNGKIIDAYGNPIDHAYIVNESTNTHAHTNELGIFTIDKTESKQSLKITALGYKRTNFPVESNNSIIVLNDDIFRLNEIVIQPKLDAMNIVSKIDLETNPVNSSQEILRKVPGLFIGQHAGGGKAEQIFLRGFDIDHGTDIAINVDGMPVNMVSHAHGQGYADLHFVIRNG